MNGLVALYHRLPVPARSMAATLRGWYLRFWRGGAARARQIAAAQERDGWSPEQWRAWRSERLAFVLERAATRVPYYREQWAARRRRGDRASWDQVENWPLLEKDTVRAQPRAFVADDCDVRRMFHDQSSGTTGKPIEIWRSRETVTALYALVAARTRGWHGIAAGVPWARLGGQLVTPVSQRRPPFWVWNAAMKQLYLSSYHLAPDLLPHYLDALARHRVAYLAGYPSSLTVLAESVLRLGRRDLRMAVVFTNAEPLSAEQRAVIAAAFQCPVRETYGMAETVAAASECAQGALHEWPEVGWIEALEDRELICTGLLNADMPLVRYRVGDFGRVAPETSRCACGRLLPVIAGVDGRTSDLVITRDGRRVFWLGPAFYGLPVRQTQVVQETLTRLRVRVVPQSGFDAGAERAIAARLQDRLGETEVVVEQVAEIPRTAAGKQLTVVCNISAAERRAALGPAVPIETP